VNLRRAGIVLALFAVACAPKPPADERRIAVIVEIPLPGAVRPQSAQLPSVDRSPRFSSPLFAEDSDFGAVYAPAIEGAPADGPRLVTSFFIRGSVAESSLKALVADAKKVERRRVFLDPPIEITPGTQCIEADASTEAQAEELLGVRPMARLGMDGSNVLVGIVDDGFDEGYVRSAHTHVGFERTLGFPQSDPHLGHVAQPKHSHGTMVAYDATIAAPRATLTDIRLMERPQVRVSDAIKAFKPIVVKAQADLFRRWRGMVLVNSWEIAPSLINERFNSPVNSPPCQGPEDPRYNDIAYAANRCHPINRVLDELSSAGVDVVFAAGNYGSCDGNCGREASGSITGPNSHPEVLTVAAVDVNRRRIRDSGAGPGALTIDKPDVSGWSHIQASQTVDNGVDSRTSAAAAVTAGLVAAVRSAWGPPRPGRMPSDLRRFVVEHAAKQVRDASGIVELSTHSCVFGFGVATGQAFPHPTFTDDSSRR
jgi:hypothetical protein